MSSSLEGLDPTVDGPVLEAVAIGLGRRGWAVVDQAVPQAVVDALATELVGLDQRDLTLGGVGRDDQWQTTNDVRRDRIHWLTPQHEASAWYLRWVESLRLGLNRSLYLGLRHYECHFAWYSPGAFYSAHVDSFRGDDNRKVSTVLYLNNDWQTSDGGELVLYESIAADDDFDATTPLVVNRSIAPTGARLVCFLSDEVPHEVLTAGADRYSIAGWFDRRAGRGDR